MHNFVLGQLYNRQKDIHDVYGGIRQTGISPSRKSPFIFLFTGSLGNKYGYEDGWDSEGTFHYTGEGKTGDMRFTNGNKAILEHQTSGKDILLFEQLGKGKPYRYLGEFVCISYEEKQIPDENNQIRKGIIFHLLSGSENADYSLTDNASDDLSVLKQKAYAAAKNAPKQTPKQGKTTYYQRSNDVKAYVLKRANGVCECCGEKAPFYKKNGEPYLEPHHIFKISDRGLDHPKMMAAITPNCHRRIHFSAEGEALDKELHKKIQKIENSS